ncbi:MAG: NAD(P)H-hydrate dehydratase [Pyrinomonadaceae bacterium]
MNMQKVLTAEQMREVDRLTTERYGIPSILLMENAAHTAARVITEKLGGSVAGKSFLILCGKGNNGGDGAALGRILWTQGANVDIYLLGKVKETKGDARTNYEILSRIEFYEISKYGRIPDSLLFFVEVDDIESWKKGKTFYDIDVVVDALFGTGLNKPVTSKFKNLIKQSGKFGSIDKLVVSIDVPSGLNSDFAYLIGENFRSDLTVAFTAPKLANVFPPASNFNGELHVANIGSPQELIDNSPSQTFVAEKKDARVWLNKTQVKTDSYKKTRGTALLIAGSKSYSGAAILAANACFAAGAGMVSVGVPKSVQEIVATKILDEIITRAFSETKNGAFAKSAVKDVLELSGKMNVIALGCGLTSDDESTRSFVREVVENRKTPVVIDADGLNALAPFDLEGSSNLPLILTPHIGEFQRILGTNEEIKDRIKMAREFSQKHKVILVLKGERSLIAAPSGEVVINPTGNAGISRAGSGDTLTGIITGFLAQTYGTQKPNLENTFETVIAALYVAGLAGDIAAKKLSDRLMSASDIRGCLNEAIKSITNYE